MTRRQALLGVVVAITAILGRRYVAKTDDSPTWSDNALIYEPPKHQSVIFEAGYIEKVIIEREDKPDIEILFSDIIEALEGI